MGLMKENTARRWLPAGHHRAKDDDTYIQQYQIYIPIGVPRMLFIEKHSNHNVNKYAILRPAVEMRLAHGWGCWTWEEKLLRINYLLLSHVLSYEIKSKRQDDVGTNQVAHRRRVFLTSAHTAVNNAHYIHLYFR